jgi:hypothetical protein
MRRVVEQAHDRRTVRTPLNSEKRRPADVAIQTATAREVPRVNQESNSDRAHGRSLDDIRRMWECALARLKDALEAQAAANSAPRGESPHPNGRCHRRFNSSKAALTGLT